MDYLVLQIETNRVLAARFAVSGASLSFAGGAEFALDEEQTLSDVARRIAAGSDGSPRIVLCLPASLFAQRMVELPFDNLRKVREVLPGQMQGEIALPLEEVVFDLLPAGEKRYLALWARKAEVGKAIDTFREAGCEPQIVTSVPFAWGFLPGSPADALVYDGTVLAVINNGRVTLTRTVCPGDRREQLAAAMTALEMSGVSFPQRLVVFGEGVSLLADGSLSLPVERLVMPESLASLFTTDEAFQQLAGVLAVARACHAGALPDFRRADLAWTADNAALLKGLRKTAILAALLVLLLFVSKGLQYLAVKNDLASLDKSVASLYREVFPNRARAVDEVAEIKGEIRKLTGAETSGSLLEVLKKMAEARGNSINGLYEVELEGGNLRVKGDARSPQGVNEFKGAVAPLMVTVALGEMKSRPDGSTSFTLAGTLKEAKK